MKECTSGRVTIPTDVDVVPETLDLVKRWGADAIRDCDGTDYPEELKNVIIAIIPTCKIVIELSPDTMSMIVCSSHEITIL